MIPALILLFFTVFSFNSQAQSYSPTEMKLTEGKGLYVINCIRCHNANPTKAGAIGPELYTTPNNVFTTKVPNGTYPNGYAPKRRTKIMPKFKSLTTKTDLIYNYIRSFKNDKN